MNKIKYFLFNRLIIFLISGVLINKNFSIACNNLRIYQIEQSLEKPCYYPTSICDIEQKKLLAEKEHLEKRCKDTTSQIKNLETLTPRIISSVSASKSCNKKFRISIHDRKHEIEFNIKEANIHFSSSRTSDLSFCWEYIIGVVTRDVGSYVQKIALASNKCGPNKCDVSNGVKEPGCNSTADINQDIIAQEQIVGPLSLAKCSAYRKFYLDNKKNPALSPDLDGSYYGDMVTIKNCRKGFFTQDFESCQKAHGIYTDPTISTLVATLLSLKPAADAASIRAEAELKSQSGHDINLVAFDLQMESLKKQRSDIDKILGTITTQIANAQLIDSNWVTKNKIIRQCDDLEITNPSDFKNACDVAASDESDFYRYVIPNGRMRETLREKIKELLAQLTKYTMQRTQLTQQIKANELAKQSYLASLGKKTDDTPTTVAGGGEVSCQANPYQAKCRPVGTSLGGGGLGDTGTKRGSSGGSKTPTNGGNQIPEVASNDFVDPAPAPSSARVKAPGGGGGGGGGGGVASAGGGGGGGGAPGAGAPGGGDQFQGLTNVEDYVGRRSRRVDPSGYHSDREERVANPFGELAQDLSGLGEGDEGRFPASLDESVDEQLGYSQLFMRISKAYLHQLSKGQLAVESTP